MKEIENKKSAVDVTELAVGIILLGVVVSIGAYIMNTQRDTHLTELTTFTTVNESKAAVANVRTLDKTWVKSVVKVYNDSGFQVIDSGNYTLTVDSINGQGKITNTTGNTLYANNWNITYDNYNTSSRADWTLSDKAATGIGEYGNWFKIIVIVGIAALVLSVIFLAFGGRRSGSEGGIGGEY